MEYRLSAIPSGLAGTDATLKEIGRLVEYDLQRPQLRLLATRILRRHAIPSKHHLAEAKALYNYVVRTVRYQKDPIGLETVQSPTVTLQVRAGDCDDHSGLLAALAAAVGIPARFRVVGYTDDHIVHIFPELFVNGRWLPADTTEPGRGFGWRPTSLPYERVYNLTGEVQAMAGANPQQTMTQGDFRRTLKDAVSAHLQDYWQNGLLNLADVRGYQRVIREGNFPSTQPLLVEPTQEAIDEFVNYVVENQIASVKPADQIDGMGSLDGFLGSVWNAVKGVGKSILGIKDAPPAPQVIVQPAAPVYAPRAVPEPSFWAGTTPIYIGLAALGALLVLPRLLK